MHSFRQTFFLALSFAAYLRLIAGGTPSLFTTKTVDDFLAHNEGECFFAITGLVEQTDLDHKCFILHDPLGRNQCYSFAVKCPHKGEMVVAEGTAHVSPAGEPAMVAYKITQIGNGYVKPPIPIFLKDLDERKHNLATIQTVGTIVEVTDDDIDPGNCFLLLKDQEIIMPAACPKSAKAKLQRLIDSEVQITGIFRSSISGIRKYSGPFIDLSNSVSITVVRPAPADIFNAPPLEKRLYLTPKEIARLGRRTVRGRILAVWGAGNLMVKESDGRISHIQLAEGEHTPLVDTTGIAVGYPETDLYRINLSKARFKSDGTISVPDDEPEDTSVETILKANWHRSDNCLYHGRLIRIHGLVRNVPSRYDEKKRILLVCGSLQVFVDISANPSIANLTPLDCEIAVVGRCLLETDNWHADKTFPKIKGIVVIPRSPSDIFIVTPPPWWTSRRLLVVIGILFAVTLGLIARNRIQKRIARLKMADHTRLAVELHDSISQNLTGASLQIDAVSELIDTDRAKALKRLDIASKTLVSCHQELRNCIWDLRNNALDEKDMATAIRKTVEQHIGDAELFVRFNVPRDRLSDNSLHATLRIIRELATNAARHGEATTIRIAGAIEEDRLLFSVTDDGVGFDPKNHPGIAEGHFGLQGVEERVAELGGEITVESEIGKGTRVAIWIRSRC